ncbi:MAG: COG2426 family protein [Mahellales bacterium]
MDFIRQFFSILSDDLVIIGISAIPLLELKAAIPLAISLGFDPLSSLILGIIGGMLPVPLVLVYIKPVIRYLRKTKIFGRPADWLFNRSMRKSETVKKYSLIGLFILVALPLPGTGVWTGATVAAFLGLEFKRAFISILLGNIVAGIIVLFVSNQIIPN